MVRVQCLNTHLDAPLSNSLLQQAADLFSKTNHISKTAPKFPNLMIKNLYSQIKLLHRYCPLNWETCISHPQENLGHLYEYGIKNNDETQLNMEFQQFWMGTAKLSAISLTKLQTEKFKDPLTNFNLLTQLQRGSRYQELLNLYRLRSILEYAVVQSAKPPETLVHDSNHNKGWDLLTSNDGVNCWKRTFSLDNKVHFIMYLTDDCFLLIDGISNHVSVSTRNHYLMFSDIISQRFLLLLTAAIKELIQEKAINYLSYEQLSLCFGFGDNLLAKYGNDGYALCAMWESLITGVILSHQSDLAIDEFNFLSLMVTEFCNLLGAVEQPTLQTYLVSFLLPYLYQFENMNLLSQLFGLYRIWGHPTLDPLAGVRKLKSIACRPRVVNPLVIKVIACKWREYFCMNYYRKHKRWPEMTFHPHAPPSELLTSLKNGTEVSPLSKGYQLDHWYYIKFTQTFLIPDKYELSEMISDKAMSHDLKDLRHYSTTTGTIGPAHTRNVIIQWLQNNYNNPQDFLKDIDQNGFGKEECVVGVCPKERELKLAARLFGLLTIRKRLYVVLTEALLADFILPYFPEITMTFDQNSLMSRILRNTKNLTHPENSSPSKNKTKYSVITNLDFNKWNSYMRYDETQPLFEDFDHLFGLSNCFLRTHSMFSESWLYLADGSITMTFDDDGFPLTGPGVWKGHLGGIEGLRQKGWTIFTVIILKCVAEEQRVTCELMGQGDNQVLIITYIVEDLNTIQNLHQDFLNHLNLFLTRIGPPLKIQETWSSSYFFIYGKYPVYLGKPLSMSLKKICRTMRLTNEGLQNIESTLSSITANVSAATLSDFDPVIPFIVGLFETLGALHLHLSSPFYIKGQLQCSPRDHFLLPQDGKAKKIPMIIKEQDLKSINQISLQHIMILAMTPCILGGYPTVQLCDLMNHGFPDPLTLNIWSLCHFYDHSNLVFPQVRPFILKMLDPRLNDSVSPEMLCQDPVSLNLLHSSSGGEKIKRLVFEFLTTKLNVKNTIFLTFLQKAKSRQTELCDILYQMTPLNPRVANSILESTIVGRAMQIIAKVNKTNTLINLMIKNKAQDIKAAFLDLDDNDLEGYGTTRIPQSLTKLFGRFEYNYYKSILFNLYYERETFSREDITCSTLHADKLREASWKKKLTGVTVAVPQEYLVIQPSEVDDCRTQYHTNSELGFVQIRTELTREILLQSPLYNLPLGPFKPFFGSKTKNKVKYEGGELKKVAPPLMHKVLDLTCLIGWGTKTNSNLSELISLIWSSFTDLPINLCVPEHNKISGSIEHRWMDSKTSHQSSISILYDFLTHLNLNTNNFHPELIKHCVGATNFNVIFQAIFTSLATWWSSQCIYNTNQLFTCYHAHIQCTNCIQPINEDQLDVPPLVNEHKLFESLVPDKNNPYTWVSASSLFPELSLKLPTLGCFHSTVTLDQMILEAKLLAVEWLLDNHPVAMTEHLSYGLAEESTAIYPVNCLLIFPISELLELFILFKIIRIFICRAKAFSCYDPTEDLTKFYISQLDALGDCGAIFYKPLISIFVFPPLVTELLAKYPGIYPPAGTPPSEFAKCNFFKKIIDSYILPMYTLPKFLDSLKNMLKDNLFIQSQSLAFNPLSLHLLWTAFSNPLIFSKAMSALGVIKDHLKLGSSGLILSQVNFVKLPATSISLLTAQIPWHLFNLPNERSCDRMVFVSSALDVLVKSVKELGYVLQLEEPKSSSKLNISSVSQLGPTMIIIMNQVATQTVTLHQEVLNINIKLQKIPHYSFYNHFLASYSPITRSPYKILSLLNWLINKHPLETSIFMKGEILVLGDGSGGSSATIQQIFPKAQLFSSTLFELEKLGSAGLEKYVPSFYYYNLGLLQTVKGLSLTEEHPLDMKLSTTLTSLARLSNQYHLIFCDIEGTDWTVVNILNITFNILSLACHSKLKSSLIIKCYAENILALYCQYHMLSIHFKNLYLVRSLFATPGVTECYIICLNPIITTIFKPYKFQGETIILQRNPKILLLPQFQQLVEQSLGVSDLTARLSDPYSDLLSQDKSKYAGWEISTLREYMNHVDKNYQVFPLFLIKKWRQEYPFTRLQAGVAQNKTPFKRRFLTIAIVSHIAYDYLTWFSLLINKEDSQSFAKFQYVYESGYIQFFPTIDRSWSMNCYLQQPPPKYKSVSFKFTIILSKSQTSELFSTCGRMASLKSQIGLTFLNSLDNPTVPFRINEGYGLRNRKTSYPLSWSPLPPPRYSGEHWVDYAPIVLNWKNNDHDAFEDLSSSKAKLDAIYSEEEAEWDQDPLADIILDEDQPNLSPAPGNKRMSLIPASTHIRIVDNRTLRLQRQLRKSDVLGIYHDENQ